MPYSSSKTVFLPLLNSQTFTGNDRPNVPISYLDGIRSVKVSGKKVNVALDKELRGR
jgi:hypothetical protein